MMMKKKEERGVVYGESLGRGTFTMVDTGATPRASLVWIGHLSYIGNVALKNVGGAPRLFWGRERHRAKPMRVCFTVLYRFGSFSEPDLSRARLCIQQQGELGCGDPIG